MKIVLDTNVLISAIFWGGLPGKILELWINNKIELLICENILSEYLDVIKEISKNKDPILYEDWKIFILEHSTLIQSKNHTSICRDPKDNMFLNCAISGRANFIISGDKDLLDIKKIENIKIINTPTFLKLYKII